MKKLSWILLATLMWTSNGFAGVYLDDNEGTPYRWKNFPIQYKVDNGALSSGTPAVDQTTGATWVRESFDVWQNSTIGNVSFSEVASALPDIDETNYTTYLTFENGIPRPATTDTIIIFDDDRAILNRIFGSALAQNILGIASPGQFDEANLEITAGVAIINGLGASGTGVTEAEVKSTLVHEFGHMLNIAHSQLNWEDELNDGDSAAVPTMFPFQLSSSTEAITLELDDLFSLGFLYPDTTNLPSRGTITGSIERGDETGVRGVNVICRETSDPRKVAVTWISGVDLQDGGDYICGALTSGSYTVETEPVYFSIRELLDPAPAFIVDEFYSGSSEGFDSETDKSSLESGEVKAEVSVASGQTVNGIDIIANNDGRLISGETVTGTTAAGHPDFTGLIVPIGINLPPLAYTITVPEGASQLTIELVGTDPDIDLDIVGRCNDEFSLALPAVGTAPPLYPGTSFPGTPQAEFFTDDVTGNETVVLNSSSEPELQACKYHIMVPKFGTTQNTTYELTATIEGANPQFSVELANGGESSSGSGETTVMSRNLVSQDDTFRFSGITITDSGNGDLSLVSRARLYIDDDSNGELSSGDRVISSTTNTNTSDRKIMFTNFTEFVTDGSSKTLLVTYDISGSSASSAAWIFMLGILGMLFRKKRRGGYAVAVLACVLLLGSCGGSTDGYHPGVAETTDVIVTGESFGTNVQVRLRESPSSVADFFN